MIKKYLYEIKNRLLLIGISWTSNVIISYNYKDTLLYLSIKPSLFLYKTNTFYFIYTDLSEPFYTYIQLVFLISNQILLFYFIYQIFMFITPGLYIFEYNILNNTYIKTIIIYFSSTLFLYNFILPWSWKFFLKFQTDQKISFFFEAKLNEYFTFIYTLNSIVLVFTIIILSLFLIETKTKIFYFKHYKKIIYLTHFLIAAIITPPDIFSQICIGTIFILLFEIIIFLTIFNDKIKNI
jgi:sec-independent protein translocase protein TatC